jgi:stalled ribosome rescue protein Dom34
MKNKIAVRKLGVCMDHFSAHFIEFDSEHTVQKKGPVFYSEEGSHHPGSSEQMKHNREQHLLTTYYKKIAEAIKEYSDIVLFGPTDAKTELLNTIKSDVHFAHIRMNTVPTDKMTENEQQAFVKNYFLKELN